MKRILLLITLLTSFLLVRAQETPPSGLKAVNAQFYLNPADSSIWHFKGKAANGTSYGWERLGRYKDVAAKLNLSDSTLFARKTNTITINGTTQQLGANPSFTVSGGSGGSSGTVTSVSSTTADISVANPTTTPALTLNTINGKPISYFDPTSSIQTQLNGKQASLGYTAENQANKVQSVTNSATDYPSTAAITSALSGKQNNLSLTTTGTSGAATLTGSTLNIPQYAGQTYTGSNGVVLTGNNFTSDTTFNRTTANSFTKAQTNTQISNALAPYQTAATADTKYPLLTGSYANPSWITSLPWSKVTSTPTSLSGYGITNGQTNTIGSKPASTGSSYAIGDNLEQALANHDNAIATNTSAISNKQDKIISTYTYGTNTAIANTDDIPGAFGKAQAQIDTKATLSQIDASAITLNEEGTIISDNFDRASLGSNWAPTGSGTYAIASNQLQVNGNSSTYGTSTFVTYTPYGNSNLESFTVTEDIYPGTISSTNFGTGIGFESNGTYYKSNLRVMVRFDTGNVGKIEFDNSGNTGNWSNISTNGLSISAGDHLGFTIKFIKNKFIATVYDYNTNQSNTFELSISLAANYSFGIPNAYRFTIIGGGNVTNNVDNFKVVSNDLVGVNYLLIGDSITKGIGTSNIFYRWGELINQVSNTITQTNAGNGNTIDDINVNEIVALHPKVICLLIGINDIQNSETLTTIESKYTNLVNQLSSNGYTPGTNLYVISLLPGPNYNPTFYSQVPTFNSWLNSTYSTAYIDVNTPLHSTSGVPFNAYYTMDGIHPNDVGHSVIADVLLNKLQLQSKPKKQGDYYPLVYNPTGGITIGEPTLRSSTPRYIVDILGAANPGTSGVGTLLHLANTTSDNGGFITSGASNSLWMGGGIAFNAGNQVIKDPNWSIYAQYGGAHTWYAGTGTIGNTVNPTTKMNLSNAGLFSIGSQTATAFADIQGGTSSNSAFRIRSGVVPGTTNDGEINNSSTTHHLTVNLNGTTYQLDQQNVNSVSTATDANYTISSASSYVELPTITAARTVSLPTASSYTGQTIKVVVLNTASGFQWSFPASTVYDATGTAITALTNGLTYYLESNGTLWRKISAN
jgi:lysophospholipase L1-like esterase